ncbi:hypothetical protein HPB50_021783 [Hyalomma asiaticum]|uniref:Uncharacterized protein n=1 Tax=Hyalomma asiaticum TaxID=266040 RepID=A0ACB7S933_HYAAI|nr:hypothetical protein HPB50_021783 [Hyalomma asiaticum]
MAREKQESSAFWRHYTPTELGPASSSLTVVGTVRDGAAAVSVQRTRVRQTPSRNSPSSPSFVLSLPPRIKRRKRDRAHESGLNQGGHHRRRALRWTIAMYQ